MTRLSGIQLLALSLALWALAVWIFGTPHPVATATATAPPASVEKMAETGTGTSEAAGVATTAASGPSAPANQGSTALPDPGATVGGSNPQSGSARTAEAGVAPATSSSETPATAAVTGHGSRVALAPAPAGDDSATATPTLPGVADAAETGAGSATGSPITPRSPDGGSSQGSASGSDLPPASARPPPWVESPMHRPPPPARSGGAATNGNAVAGQLNAARRAAWEGRLADALSRYRAAARIQPDHHVVWGEMGNVLWVMQRWPEAAYALEGAATLLVRVGELRAASELVPAVGSIDPDAAYRVQRLLWAAAQRQPG